MLPRETPTNHRFRRKRGGRYRWSRSASRKSGSRPGRSRIEVGPRGTALGSAGRHGEETPAARVVASIGEAHSAAPGSDDIARRAAPKVARLRLLVARAHQDMAAPPRLGPSFRVRVQRAAREAAWSRLIAPTSDRALAGPLHPIPRAAA